MPVLRPRGTRAGARFCESCGARLDVPEARELRKVVTVLFCDVTGSTSLGEHLDSESLRRVMQRYEDDTLRAARAAVELRERLGPVNDELRA